MLAFALQYLWYLGMVTVSMTSSSHSYEIFDILKMILILDKVCDIINRAQRSLSLKLHSHCADKPPADTIISRICAGSEGYPAGDFASADASARTLFKR